MCHPDVRGSVQRVGSGVPVLAGAVGRWFVTPHAVRRYIERVPGRREWTYGQARDEIVRESRHAHFVRCQVNGLELWRAGKPLRTRFLVARGFAGLPQLVTVLRGWG